MKYNLLTNKTKVSLSIWDYRGFRIEKIKNQWILSTVIKGFQYLKGYTNPTINGLCHELDLNLGRILPKQNIVDIGNKVIELDLEKIFIQKNINGKADNDIYNKQREECIYRWLNNEYIQDIELEHDLRKLLLDEFKRLGIIDIINCKKIGGLQSRDFELNYFENGIEVCKYIEFKSTQSKNPNAKNMLFQKYMNKSNYFTDKDQDYIKLYYDKYIPKLIEYYNIKEPITFSEYKKFVYSTGKGKDVPKFFTELDINQKNNQLNRKQEKIKSYCNLMAKESINEHISVNIDSLNIPNIEHDLNVAIKEKKDFWLVWSQLNKSFKLSKTQNLKILSHKIKKGLSGNMNAIELNCVWLDVDGNQLDNFDITMLLRWKNHNGVFGPAYQFS